ncbi:alpha/beta fold hydrolase [Hwanghaeella sp.]|uniref:alpha/beta fold hydrolase n=1 Tax=Hwanghaeella sp. TaxID=2605943 RepID=UPI003CCB8C0E
MRASWMKRVGIVLAVILVLAGGLAIAAQVLDPVNTLYKRMKASSPYMFEEIDPALTKTDPAALLSIQTAADVASARVSLLGWIYGTVPAERRKARFYDPRSGWSHGAEILDWNGLRSVNQFYINPRPDVISYGYLLKPKQDAEGPGAGRALIYHNGMASTFTAARDWLEPFLEDGWTILAFDQLGYGENTREIDCDKRADGTKVPDGDGCIANLQQELSLVDDPVAIHVEPVLAGLDLLQVLGFDQVDALGFSAGAATVTMAAAVDERLRRTVAAAGILPPYLREGQDRLFGIARELAENGPVSFLDLFVLAGAGEGRAYHQLFNRYDRCCFRNVKGKHYEGAVKNTLAGAGSGGAFTVTIDESHARHAISAAGVRTIKELLEN